MKTIRQQIMDCLLEGPLSGVEISQALGIKEKEVYDHLPYVAQSVIGQGKRFLLYPANCLSCGYVFKKRKRFTRPSRCPLCRATHLQRPTYEIL